MSATRVLILGAAGHVGRCVVRQLAEDSDGAGLVLATDLREVPPADRCDGVEYRVLDIRSPSLAETLRDAAIDVVVHLAAVVTPRPGDTRERQYAIDVLGTRNVLEACVAAGVKRIVYTSSGAAYGYHPDMPAMLDEDAPLRGNEVFAYAWHKRLVEQELATCREEHPELEQLIFRVSTVLGDTLRNQITAMFERPVVLGLKGAASPFCFVWDEDVARAITLGVRAESAAGVFNLTGDGVMTLREIAGEMGRPFVALPTAVVQRTLSVLQRFGAAPYGPEQTLFLEHRPVLSNTRLKESFGFIPSRTTRQALLDYRDAHLER